MKKAILMTLCTTILLAIIGTGCSNNNAKAQALLVEAISYSDGNAPSQTAQDKALALAATKKFKPSSKGLSEAEVVMVAGGILCDQILTEYPNTPAAVKASELKQQINQKLRNLANERIHSWFRQDD